MLLRTASGDSVGNAAGREFFASGISESFPTLNALLEVSLINAEAPIAALSCVGLRFHPIEVSLDSVSSKWWKCDATSSERMDLFRLTLPRVSRLNG